MSEARGTAVTQVNQTFLAAKAYADTATQKASDFSFNLGSALFDPPAITIEWESVQPPPPLNLPPAPTLPPVDFLPPIRPSADIGTAPDTDIDDNVPDIPPVFIPNVPTPTFGAAPVIPNPTSVPLPAAPALSMPLPPAQLAISVPGFSGLNLREDWLDRLDDIPELQLLPPTPYSYSPGPKYESAVLDALKASIQARLQGGTGLPPAVEQALWGRAKDRETKTALSAIAEVGRQSESLGYHLPPGVVAAQLRAAQEEYHGKLSSLSRDISIKQAELEQLNLREVVAQGIQLETQLIDQAWKLEQLAFETSKQYAENAVRLYNAELDRYKTLLEGYRAYAAVYKEIIQAEMAKVEVYRAQIDAEKSKADVNKAMVDAYKAEIEGSLAQVEIYRAQVAAAQTLVQLEEAKIGAAGEQVKAYVATVNAETAKVEAFKAQVQGQIAVSEVSKARIEAFAAKVQAQGETARAKLGAYTAKIQAKSVEWDGYRAQVAAEGERMRALATQSSTRLDQYRASISASIAEAEAATKNYEARVSMYAAQKQYAMMAEKVNADTLIATNAARLDAAKVGAQVHAQLAASAYGMMNAQASVAAQDQYALNFNYSGETGEKSPD